MTSLLHHSTPIPMRTLSDKEMEIVDLDQLFDEYVETDLLQHHSDWSADRSSSDDLAHLFELHSSNEKDAFATSTRLDLDTDISWQKAAPKCEQNPASSMSSASSSLRIDANGKESLSDSELLSFEDLFELERNQLRSISQPSTPRPHTAKSVKKAVSFHDKSVSRGIQKTLKKSPSAHFARMMQPSFYRAPIPDIWTRKMDTPADSFGLRVAPNGITSPPLSSKLVQHENHSGFFAQHHQPYPDEQSPLASPTTNQGEMNFSNYQLTPQASPAIGISNNNNGDPFSDNMGMAFSSSASSAALSALQTPPSSLRLPMTTWGPETSPAMNFDFSASPDFSATKTAGWWDDEASQPSAGPTYRESNSRSTSQAIPYTSADLGGLGITCDNSSFGDFGVAGLGISAGDMTASSHTQHAHPASASSFDMASYTAMYPTPPHTHIVPIGHRPLSRTPSPCPQPRFHRRRPSSHAHTQHTQHHRATSSSRSERRKSSHSSNNSASRQSSSANVGFVNFTPHDSRKILTGVAPSGSSKTKARREKEAAEKRRKLSQAAVKAVMEAGGDVDSLRRLEREGLLVLEG
ncbi:hypothetical protein FB567DRAFT_447592 [Paraphoma chrysanthemicola]|uniref:Developmental regulatory protein wetA n=1 Tax=Paraphoma chrysanthemicola TaxID=798071 RepID=A0A8K0R3Y5_9PLEO|nr:hypothetical protein FB567DRAFT_447592 [Paraphoma chrysanthemicola]